jgi:diguanylate cyclase (GGDEF)-like protein/PAS domain S-box-containing protein
VCLKVRRAVADLQGMTDGSYGELRRADHRPSSDHALVLSEQWFRAVVANVPGIVYRSLRDEVWTIEFMSDYTEELTGYPASDFMENNVRTYGSIIHPDDRPYVREEIERALEEGRPYRHEYRIIHADGTVRWLAEHGRGVREVGGDRVWLDGVLLDVTQQKSAEHARAEAELQLKKLVETSTHQALHDPLTGLPNRTLFRDHLREVISDAGARNREFTVLMLDLDGFKEINDTLGHGSGDRLLLDVAVRLRALVRQPDFVARLGGDEFAVILPGASAGSALEVVQRIRGALDVPIELDGISVRVEASVGIAAYPRDGTTEGDILRGADTAMYAAKDARSGYAVYSSDDRHEPARLTVASDLRRALDEDELFLVYQPKLCLRTGAIVGVEALVRWSHPQRGLVLPDEFIPVAQQTSLIRPLTVHVLGEALRQSAAWRADGLELSMAVNLSMRNLLDISLPEDVARLLDTTGVPPSSLVLEITESALIADPVHVRSVVDELAAMGVHLSIDDFGTGYSSLSYLKRLPIHEIKIDRSFVRNLTSSEEDAIIVSSTVDLANNLGLRVVAEGVETSEVLGYLRAIGCDIAQGFHLGKPLPAAELDVWLRASMGGQQAEAA